MCVCVGKGGGGGVDFVTKVCEEHKYRIMILKSSAYALTRARAKQVEVQRINNEVSVKHKLCYFNVFFTNRTL